MTSTSRRRIGIVGAGISGLAAAWELTKAGCDVVVYDRRQPGGLGGGFGCPDVPGVYIDKFYHHLFRSDTDMIGLLEDMGLGGELGWHPSRTALWADGRLWSLESPLDFLRCRPVGSLVQRLRMAAALRRFQTTASWQAFDELTCEAYFAARGASPAYRALWAPLLRAKFGKAAGGAPAAFLWGRIHPRAGSRVGGREMLGYLRGGFERGVCALAGAIAARGGTIRAPEPVLGLTSDCHGVTLTAAGGQERFDAVVWTAAPELLAQVATGLAPETSRRLTAVEYMAVTCLVLLMSRRQSDYYWINNLDPSATFGGLIEHTNLVSPADYHGHHVLYVVNYLEPDDPMLALNRRDLLDRHLPSLRRVLPGFRREDIRHAYDFKDRYSTPVYTLGYRKRMPPPAGLLEHVWLAGMAQVYPHDRNMSHCIRNAKDVVRRLLATPARQARHAQEAVG